MNSDRVKSLARHPTHASAQMCYIQHISAEDISFSEAIDWTGPRLVKNTQASTQHNHTRGKIISFFWRKRIGILACSAQPNGLFMTFVEGGHLLIIHDRIESRLKIASKCKVNCLTSSISGAKFLVQSEFATDFGKF
jgi:hypothetical protein